MSSSEGVVSGSGLDLIYSVVVCVFESVTAFVILHSVNERSVGLAVVGRVAVEAGNLADSVVSQVRSRRLRLGKGSRKDIEEEFVTLMSCCLCIFYSSSMVWRGSGGVVGEGGGERVVGGLSGGGLSQACSWGGDRGS